MTEALFSRRRVALNILTIPFQFVSLVATSAWEAIKRGASDVRDDFLPAIRYVLTGDHNPGAVRAAVTGAAVNAKGVAVSAAQTTGKAARGFYKRQVEGRLIALMCLALLPAFIVWALVEEVAETEIAQDAWQTFLDLIESLGTGRRPWFF